MVTGSSGSCTAAVKSACEQIFTLNKISVACVSRDGLHFHSPGEICDAFIEAAENSNPYFNLFDLIPSIINDIKHLHDP